MANPACKNCENKPFLKERTKTNPTCNNSNANWNANWNAITVAKTRELECAQLVKTGPAFEGYTNYFFGGGRTKNSVACKRYRDNGFREFGINPICENSPTLRKLREVAQTGVPPLRKNRELAMGPTYETRPNLRKRKVAR